MPDLSKAKHFLKRFIPKSILLNRRLLQSKLRLQPRKNLYFEIHAAEHCNLNCKWCSNFSQLAEEEFLDLQVFKTDCQRLSQLTNRKMEAITVMGGEPMLHPNITKIFDIIRNYFDNGSIHILTNGLLLLNQDDYFWKNCNKNTVKIFVSYYPIGLKYNEIVKIANKYSVEIMCEGKGMRTMRRDVLDLEGKQDIEKNFKLCFKANGCIQLHEGKMYTCSVIPYIRHFNKYYNEQLEVSEKDYIDIYKVTKAEDIYDFLCKPVPFCRYCNIKKSAMNGLKWEVSKKEKSEYV